MTKQDKTEPKAPLVLRIVGAGDISEEKVEIIARDFALKNGIDNYELEYETDESLIGGFVIYTNGFRYDYSLKGQLGRIGEYVKRSRDIEADINEDGEVVFDKDKISSHLSETIREFPESPAISIESSEFSSLDDKALRKRIEEAFDSSADIEEVGIVMSVNDGVATVSCLERCMLSEPSV